MIPYDWDGVVGAVCVMEVTAQVACSDTLHLHFLSGIDRPEIDEAWAFSGVRVIARPPAEAPASANNGH